MTSGERFALGSLCAGGLVLGLKGAAWWLTGSAAFYSDALESTVNVAASVIALVALRFADFGYILENGRVVLEGNAASLAANEDVKEFYLGIAEGRRKSFRDVKHYKRRKRWLA